MRLDNKVCLADGIWFAENRSVSRFRLRDAMKQSILQIVWGVGTLFLMTWPASAHAGYLSGESNSLRPTAEAMAPADDSSLGVWTPYHAEFSEVSRYLASVSIGRLGNFDDARPSANGMAQETRSAGTPIPSYPNGHMLQQVDATPDLEGGSMGAPSTSPDGPSAPQTGLCAEVHVATLQMVAFLDVEKKALHIFDYTSRLFRPPRPASPLA
jgi:hypothetical protein